MVVDNPHTGLNPIENVVIRSDSTVMVKTKFPHGRDSGTQLCWPEFREL